MPIEIEILRYVTQNPDAKDTAEGIAEWWIDDREARPTLGEVKTGLEKLVARGEMVAEQSADGRTYYSANPAGNGPG